MKGNKVSHNKRTIARSKIYCTPRAAGIHKSPICATVAGLLSYCCRQFYKWKDACNML